MKTTVDYLDEVKAHLDLPSDYAVAKALHVTRAAVSSYRVGRTSFDNLTALRVAEILNIQAIEVIAAANIERAKDSETRSLWENAWGKAAGAIALSSIVSVIGLSLLAPTPSQASTRGDNQTKGSSLSIM
ncbi:hypothetical protein [Caballeronia sp. LZ032]|uniref:hypothetical protein n=1 Tax=Caballeronia sp. LZ032 TaxID=3038565 RepID=UPI002857A7C9|nr:hypothetical protein [Caballeronia sp. LZ032]MDR5883579.1 hypothetical protein [Caballeronia sp. LZ032]